MILNRKDIYSMVVIIVFILPYLIYAKTSISLQPLVDIILLILYFFVFANISKSAFASIYSRPLIFALIFIFFGIFNQFFNGYLRIYNLIAPFAAYLGFVYVQRKPLGSFPFIALLVFNYIYFYITYYSLNPVNFLIAESEFNVESFINTSSNLIPVILIINLYIFDILNSLKFRYKHDKLIIVLAGINVFLILLQRSRAGIIISVGYFLIKIWKYNSKVFYSILLLFSAITIYYWEFIELYLQATGEISLESYDNDVRKENVDIFFGSINSIKDLFFGYGVTFEEMTSSVTQNLGITIWNYYSVFPLIMMFYLIIKRINDHRFLPISNYFILIGYSLFEGFFLSNYWDFIIYILLFQKKVNSNQIKSNYD